MRKTTLLWLCLALVACAARRRGVGEDQLHPALQAMDTAYENRALTGLQPMRTSWTVARAASAGPMPPPPEALGWRVVRHHLVEGMAVYGTVQARRSYADARERGMACLATHSPFSASVRRGDEPVRWVRGLPASHLPCAAWTAWAWVRWELEVGRVASGLDQPAIDALLTAAPPQMPLVSVGGAPLPWVHALHAEVLGRSVTGTQVQSLRELTGSQTLGPTAWVIYADALRLVLRGGADSLPRPRAGAKGPEAVAAQEHVLANRESPAP